MNKVKFSGLRELAQKSHVIVLIFITLAVLMVSSGLMELSQSRKDLYELMESQSHTLLESIMIASENSLLSNEYLEDVTRQMLLNNASMVRSMYEEGSLGRELKGITMDRNRPFRIQVLDPEGERVYSYAAGGAEEGDQNGTPWEELRPLFRGDTDTIILGIKRGPEGRGAWYSVALATQDRNAVVVSYDAREYLAFIRNTGFGSLLNQVASENRQIRFIAFQDYEGILAATGNVTSLESIESSAFLTRSLADSLYQSRITGFDGERIFEVTHPFTYKGETIGLIRMGLSSAPLYEINRRIFKRMIVSTVVLVMVGFIVITFLFIRQRLTMIQKRYEVVETYSGSIIEHVSDAIVVFSREGRIRIYNAAAENLFGIPRKEALEGTVDALVGQDECPGLFAPDKAISQQRYRIAGQVKYLLLSRSQFFDADGLEYIILVARDLTEQKQLEEQVERRQRLTAMGKLASGVAHEIRNPLNAIGTIVQQLRKDFKPEANGEEYDELTGIVYGEVRRINKTIQEFLRFSRPEPIHPSSFKPDPLIGELKTQYQTVLEEKKIELDTRIEWPGEVQWDRDQIKQVLINLLQNAIDASGSGGRITIGLAGAGKGELLLTVSDQGSGMDQKTRDNLFNLYYTTKASGTGIGLSIVQRIIYEHQGVISFETEAGKGTTFTIRLPEAVIN